MDDIDPLAPDPQDVDGWDRALERFDRYWWPLFEKRGYSKDAAFLYWTLHKIEASLDMANDAKLFDDDPVEGDEWKDS